VAEDTAGLGFFQKCEWGERTSFDSRDTTRHFIEASRIHGGYEPPTPLIPGGIADRDPDRIDYWRDRFDEIEAGFEAMRSREDGLIVEPCSPIGPSLPILTEAAAVVEDRKARYDDRERNFTRIATIWSVVFGHEVTPEQVAMCMIGLKLAREVYKPSRDNRVDLCGYADCLEDIVNGRTQEANFKTLSEAYAEA
jgi:hypothetical protein